MLRLYEGSIMNALLRYLNALLVPQGSLEKRIHMLRLYYERPTKVLDRTSLVTDRAAAWALAVCRGVSVRSASAPRSAPASVSIRQHTLQSVEEFLYAQHLRRAKHLLIKALLRLY